MELGLLALLLVGVGATAFLDFGGDDATSEAEDTGLDKDSLNRIDGELLGEEEAQRIEGTEEGDYITGAAGTEIVNGNGGNDYLESKSGAFGAYYGGAGDDKIVVHPDATSNFHDLFGGEGADHIQGGESSDFIFANGSEDVNDSFSYQGFYGDDGAVDVLEGNGGNDSLYFNAGDIATGGEGEDAFIFHDAYDAAENQRDPARITDFDPANEALTLIDEASNGDPTLIAPFDLTWSVEGDDVIVMVQGTPVVVVEGAAETFSNNNLFPTPEDPTELA